MYIDRIAISEKYNRKGFGSLIYNELYNRSKNLGIPLCCEVNTKPINQQSLDFHKKLEFSIIEEISFGKKIQAKTKQIQELIEQIESELPGQVPYT